MQRRDNDMGIIITSLITTPSQSKLETALSRTRKEIRPYIERAENRSEKMGEWQEK